MQLKKITEKNHNHQKFINLALNLAYKNMGSTGSNPIVACVIVKDDIIIATGITSYNGRPHAEINAIDKVADKTILQGAILYVTLEPCCHIGKTLPCTDTIIKYKFSQIIICTQDPDPRVNGAGIAILRNSGIAVEFSHSEAFKFVHSEAVEFNYGETEARAINKGFFKAKIFKKPYITIKIATSLDGKIATKNFHSQWITCPEARKFAHYLRAKNQAIMVGANTIRHDNPQLNCRIAGLENYSPTKIIISQNLNFTWQENILTKNSQFPTIILCPQEQQNDKNLLDWLANDKNNQAIFGNSIDNKIDLNDALCKLVNSGINSILIEGGSSLITQFIQHDLVDELIWIRSRKIIGNDSIPAIGNLNINSINDTINNFKLSKITRLGDDVLEIYQRT